MGRRARTPPASYASSSKSTAARWATPPRTTERSPLKQRSQTPLARAATKANCSTPARASSDATPPRQAEPESAALLQVRLLWALARSEERRRELEKELLSLRDVSTEPPPRFL